MIDKVREKFEAELQADIDNRSLIRINDYLLELAKTDAVCEKLLDEKKSLKGALKHMEDYCLKRIKNKSGCVPATLTDEEGFDIIREYFEIGNETLKSQTIQKEVVSLLDFI